MKLKKTIYKFSSGKISSEFYKNPQDQWHGPYIRFYSNGQKDEEGLLIFDRLIGVWKVYERDGRKRLIDTCDNGILSGIRIKFK